MSIAAAVFRPLSFLTGLLGVNVGGIPGTEYPWVFAIFSALLIAVVGAQLWFFRKKGCGYHRGPFLRAITDAATTDQRFEKD